MVCRTMLCCRRSVPMRSNKLIIHKIRSVMLRLGKPWGSGREGAAATWQASTRKRMPSNGGGLVADALSHAACNCACPIRAILRVELTTVRWSMELSPLRTSWWPISA